MTRDARLIRSVGAWMLDADEVAAIAELVWAAPLPGEVPTFPVLEGDRLEALRRLRRRFKKRRP